jgi:hypothetical protein
MMENATLLPLYGCGRHVGFSVTFIVVVKNIKAIFGPIASFCLHYKKSLLTLFFVVCASKRIL